MNTNSEYFTYQVENQNNSVNSKRATTSLKNSKEEKKAVYQNYNDLPVHPSKYSDSDNSEDEGMEDYKVGGYHPVHVG